MGRIISTHAPAGGATSAAVTDGTSRTLFLLTPLREGRQQACRACRGRQDFYSRPCGRGDPGAGGNGAAQEISTHAPAGGATRGAWFPATVVKYFYSRPCGRGDQVQRSSQTVAQKFLLTPLREGRLVSSPFCVVFLSFLLTPLREGRRRRPCGRMHADLDFYSRPCGRGDPNPSGNSQYAAISTHAPAGGATVVEDVKSGPTRFLLTPLREGRLRYITVHCIKCKFLLTPLREGRPATAGTFPTSEFTFLLTPLREGRPTPITVGAIPSLFLLTPLREGRPAEAGHRAEAGGHFYSRPCGRGDFRPDFSRLPPPNFYSRPCGRGDRRLPPDGAHRRISTHAPAGGATAIFHKSVMRFCGKLPKDDTVLCLASFGFPRRDPKAVYLAWISCANLPQKCVREGLALKDQGTSCFHEGLASHAFDPVLV